MMKWSNGFPKVFLQRGQRGAEGFEFCWNSCAERDCVLRASRRRWNRMGREWVNGRMQLDVLRLSVATAALQLQRGCTNSAQRWRAAATLGDDVKMKTTLKEL